MEVFYSLARARLGALALNRELGPNLLKGLGISILIHACVVSSPLIYRALQGESSISPPGPTIEIPLDLISILPAMPPAPIRELITPVPDAGKAVRPVPAPADDVPKDAPRMPSQEDIRHKFTDGRVDPLAPGGGGGPVAIQNLPPVEEQIPDPTIFMAVEVYPQALTTNPQPAYPELAKTARMEGKVHVQVYVDERGRVKQWHVLKSDPPSLGFEEEVLKVLPEWKFTPAIQQGNPVGVWVVVPFNFKFK